MKTKISNITSIILFIVIAFCSCKEKKGYLDKDKARGETLSAPVKLGSIYIAPIEERKDGAVKQDVTYVNGTYSLRTIVATGLRYYGLLKETADFQFFLNDMNITVVYDKTINGNFNYIKIEKPKQFAKAEKFMWEYYRLKGIKDKRANLIYDSIELLNKEPVHPISMSNTIPTNAGIYQVIIKPYSNEK